MVPGKTDGKGRHPGVKARGTARSKRPKDGMGGFLGKDPRMGVEARGKKLWKAVRLGRTGQKVLIKRGPPRKAGRAGME